MEPMETEVRLLRLQDQWLLALVNEVEDVQYGDPDCILKRPLEVNGDQLTPWPPFSDDTEVVVRSSDITVLVNASRKMTARYIEFE